MFIKHGLASALCFVCLFTLVIKDELTFTWFVCNV